MSPLELTSYTIALVILLYYLMTTIFYRYPRPLPPGPKPWPILGNFPHMGPLLHQSLAGMARKYGPLLYVRLGCVDVVVAASPSVASQFLKAHDANFLSRPPNIAAKHVAYNYQDMVFAPYGPSWRMLRKVCAVHLFSTKALDDFKTVRQGEVCILVKALADAGKEPLQLGECLHQCIINALSMVMLGRRVFSDETGKSDPKANEFRDVVTELMVVGGIFNINDFVPALEWLDLLGIAAKLKKLHKKLDNFVHTILEEHKASYKSGQHGGDFLSTLVSLKDDCDGEGGKLTDTNIKAVLLNMFVAGTDTSSITIEWAIAELIRHPKILAQVQEELDSVVGRDRLVDESDLPNLYYLQAVIKEVFRLHPTTPLSVPRMATEPCEINGYYIPKNTTLLVNIWAIGRDPEVWADPLEFCPERFLQGGERPGTDVKGHHFELIPFGAGRRICAGMSLGLRMIHFLTATLAHAFDWKLADGLTKEELDMEEAAGFNLLRKVPLMVHPLPRLPVHAYGTAC